MGRRARSKRFTPPGGRIGMGITPPAMADGGVHAHVGARDPIRDGVVHGLVREHFAAFAEQVKEVGRSLPGYVVAEFEAFLRCGVLA